MLLIKPNIIMNDLCKVIQNNHKFKKLDYKSSGICLLKIHNLQKCMLIPAQRWLCVKLGVNWLITYTCRNIQTALQHNFKWGGGGWPVCGWGGRFIGDLSHISMFILGSELWYTTANRKVSAHYSTVQSSLFG